MRIITPVIIGPQIYIPADINDVIAEVTPVAWLDNSLA